MNAPAEQHMGPLRKSVVENAGWSEGRHESRLASVRKP